MALLTNCRNCGLLIEAGWNYCPSCGANQSNASQLVAASLKNTPRLEAHAPNRSRMRRSALWLAMILVLTAVVSAGLHYERSRTYSVSGEVQWQDDNGLHFASGGKVSVYDASLPERYKRFPPEWDQLWITPDLENVKKPRPSAPGSWNNWETNYLVCPNFARVVAKQFGGSMFPVQSRFLYRPFKRSTLEEWEEIVSDPEFLSLSSANQTDVRYVFWLRRVLDSDTLSKQDVESIQKTIFPGPAEPDSREAMAKAGITGEEEFDAIIEAPLSLTETLTDSGGKFSVMLKRGTYLLVVQDDGIPKSVLNPVTASMELERGTSVWVKRVEVAGPTKVFMAEPSCHP
jgi:hypothetical protein